MKQGRTTTKLVTKISVVAAAVGMSVLAAAPAGAVSVDTTMPREAATLTVTKTVVGTPPTGTTFVLHIRCVDGPRSMKRATPQGGAVPLYDEDVNFGAKGGSRDFTFGQAASCVVTETDDGGANSKSGPVTVEILKPTTYSAVITNTFDPIVTTTTPAKAAAAVQAAPAFTG